VTVVLALLRLFSDSGDEGLPDVSGSVTMMLLLSALATSFLVSLPLLTTGVEFLLLAAGGVGAGGGDDASGVDAALLALGLVRFGPDTADEIPLAIRIKQNIEFGSYRKSRTENSTNQNERMLPWYRPLLPGGWRGCPLLWHQPTGKMSLES
jgi:hypothetical protein